MGSDSAQRAVDPTSVAWSSAAAHRFRQDPGPHNALGLVKVHVPNRSYVSLRVTPARQLFEETVRTFSSGCIRVAKPVELAEHLLRGAGAGAGIVLAAACSLTWDFSNRLAGLRAEIERERALARADTLTGLFNARAFYERGEQELSRARRYRRPLALAFLDLDGFKAVNDTQGHQAGDALLQVAADAISAAVRSTDVIARIGGDEFVVLMPEVGPAAAQAAASKVHQALLAALQAGAWDVTASTGMVSYQVPPAELNEIVRLADALMYASKRGGKGRLELQVVEEPDTTR